MDTDCVDPTLTVVYEYPRWMRTLNAGVQFVFVTSFVFPLVGGAGLALFFSWRDANQMRIVDWLSMVVGVVLALAAAILLFREALRYGLPELWGQASSVTLTPTELRLIDFEGRCQIIAWTAVADVCRDRDDGYWALTLNSGAEWRIKPLYLSNEAFLQFEDQVRARIRHCQDLQGTD